MVAEPCPRRACSTSLAARGETVATAESLTGGLLAARLTDVPGASRSFVGGVVSYATRVKVSVLDVPADVVERHGVVSEECAVAMAHGVRRRLDADLGRGHDGCRRSRPARTGSRSGPCGWPCRAPASSRRGGWRSTGDRREIREATCEAALSLLQDLLREEPGLG